ncbi:hypothetical protein F4553_002639 [Allocatelliglobosispora scoriae]|uniref:Knr4/Smi1-like domain-containing protein n=1 Tax=Allocatelliglobosispora scoriae TaxID=643052 RepID=A0A841BR18_9ACTN|nr:SMI1/KNR4 family protein [Allocatelliglobosispora scoriae]MBB5869260.1 hypothetical protein [Allocatelliglobosispora scoriae]
MTESAEQLAAIQDAYAVWRRRHRRRSSGEPVSATQIAEAEAVLGLTLPTGYVAFLTTFGVGGPNDLITPRAAVADSQGDAGGWAHVRRPFTIVNGKCPMPDPEDASVVDGAIPVNIGGCDFHTVLAVTGDLAGTVWTNDYNNVDEDSYFVWAPARLVTGERQSEPVEFLTWMRHRTERAAEYAARRPWWRRRFD